MDVSGGWSPQAVTNLLVSVVSLCPPKCDAFDDGRWVLRTRIDSHETSFWKAEQTRVNYDAVARPDGPTPLILDSSSDYSLDEILCNCAA